MEHNYWKTINLEKAVGNAYLGQFYWVNHWMDQLIWLFGHWSGTLMEGSYIGSRFGYIYLITYIWLYDMLHLHHHHHSRETWILPMMMMMMRIAFWSFCRTWAPWFHFQSQDAQQLWWTWFSIWIYNQKSIIWVS